MPQADVELILLRQLASYLATPMLVVGPEGDLLYFNEPAEPILGRRFEETGELSADELGRIFQATDEEGSPLPPEQRPMLRAIESNEPTHGRIWLRGLDGGLRRIAVTGFPLVAEGDRRLGALGIFWEVEDA